MTGGDPAPRGRGLSRNGSGAGVRGRSGGPSGRAVEAADLFFRAGRSATIEGGTAAARLWLETAIGLAEEAGRDEIRHEATVLLQRLAEDG